MVVTPVGHIDGDSRRKSSAVLTPVEQFMLSRDCRRKGSIVLTPTEKQLRGQSRRKSSLILTPIELSNRGCRRKSSVISSPAEYYGRGERRRFSVITPVEHMRRESRKNSGISWTPVARFIFEYRRGSGVISTPTEQIRNEDIRRPSTVLTPVEQFNGDLRRKLSVVLTPIDYSRGERRRSSIRTPVDQFRRRTSQLDTNYHQSPELFFYGRKRTSVDVSEEDTRAAKDSSYSSRKACVSFLVDSKGQCVTLDATKGRRNTIAHDQSTTELKRTGDQTVNLTQTCQSSSSVLNSCKEPYRKLLGNQEHKIQTPPANCLPFSPLDNSVFSSHTLSRTHDKNITTNRHVNTLGSAAFKSPPTTSTINKVQSCTTKEAQKRDSVFSVSECPVLNTKDNNLKHRDILDGRFSRRKSVAFSRKFLTPSEKHRRASFLSSKQRHSLSSLFADYQHKFYQKEAITPLFSIHANVHLPQISLGRVLGAGGFGSVYQGTYQNRLVAVKRMHAITKNQRARVASYKAELNAMRLQHPNIVQVLTSGCTESLHGDAYIVMEYAGDRNLAAVLDDPSESIDLARRLRFSTEITTALRFIHANCIIHLDLKPANVILTPKGRCKLGDFGCCQVGHIRKV